MLLVGLVIEQLDALTAWCMVASRATEQHDCATAGKDGPIGCGADGQGLLGESEPVVAVEGRGEHHDIVGALKQQPTDRPRRLP